MSKVRLAKRLAQRRFFKSTCAIGGVGGGVVGFVVEKPDLCIELLNLDSSECEVLRLEARKVREVLRPWRAHTLESLHPLVRWSGFVVAGAVTGPVLVLTAGMVSVYAAAWHMYMRPRGR